MIFGSSRKFRFLRDSVSFRFLLHFSIIWFSDLAKTSHNAINPEQCLVITLIFLANGTSYHRLSYNFRIGVSTISKIIVETCQAIWNRLKSIYLPIPNTSEEWKNLAYMMHSRWQLTNSVGTINKHYFSEILLMMLRRSWRETCSH